MIALEKPSKPKHSQRAWQAAFLEMLPAIRSSARIAFRAVGPEARDDPVEEAIANAFVAYANLIRLGKRGFRFRERSCQLCRRPNPRRPPGRQSTANP